MFQKIKIIFVICLLLLSKNVLANNGNSNNIVISEEQQCFTQLNEKIKNDNRYKKVSQIFPNGDLTKVLFDEKNNSYIDLTNYNEFLSKTSINPAYNSNRAAYGYTNKDYLLRRGHIAPIVANSNYIVSNIVGFGRDSNFTFPLSSKSFNSYGDPYKLYGSTFKEFIAYTHHSIDGKFLSCGIFKLTPLNSRGFAEVSGAGYFTNILDGVSSQSVLGNQKCHSGFEGEYLTASDGKKYYSMKSNICVLDYTQKDFVKMELLSIAYDNKSSYYNEYLIFPLQVKSMKDMDLPNMGLVEIRNTFLDYVDKYTCLQLIHGSQYNLPSGCSGQFNSNLLSYNKEYIVNTGFKKILSYLYPLANAARDFNISENELNKVAGSGMIVYENMPYSLYNKLLSIDNQTFQDFLKISLVPTFEDYILARKEQGIVISPYEETFLKCKISYEEREKIAIDFLNNLKDPKKLDLNNLTYSNPRFGDCIIPYPDKTHLSKVIPDSFDSNKLLAEQLSGKYNGPELSKEMQEFVEKQNKLNLDYQNKIDELTKNFNDGIISSDELNNKVNLEKEKLESNLEKLYQEDQRISQEINNKSKIIDTQGMITKTQSSSNIFLIFTGFIFILLGIVMVIYFFRKNNKKV